MMKHIYHHGSMTMAMRVSQSFYQYKKGIFERPAGDPYVGWHIVRVVGWGSEGGKDFWIVANSWRPTVRSSVSDSCFEVCH